MKKLLALMLIMCFVFGTMACSKKADDTTAKAEIDKDVDVSTLEKWGAVIKEQYGGTKISLMLGSHPACEAQEPMIAEFTDLTGIIPDIQYVTDSNMRQLQLLDAATGKSKFDVFQNDGMFLAEFVEKDVLLPLDDFLNNPALTPAWFDWDDVIKAYRDQLCMNGGKTYGITIAGESLFIGYRTDIFEKFNRKPPTTTDEWLDTAKFLNGKEKGVYGQTVRGGSTAIGEGYMAIGYLFGDNPLFDKDTLEPSFNQPENVLAVQFYADLMKEGPPDVSSYTYESNTAAFMQGKAAMWFDATALSGWVTDPERSLVYDKIGFTSTPTGPTGLEGAAVAGWNIGIPMTSSNPEAAWCYLMFMTSKEKSLEYIKNGGVASRTSILENPELQAKDITYAAQLENFKKVAALRARGIMYTPAHPAIGAAQSMLGTYVTMVYSGEKDAKTAADLCQEELVRIVNEMK